MWNFLVVNEEPKPADVIIVLSSGRDRVEHGVSLCQLGYANKLLFTGGGAQRMRRQAMSLGVTEDHILIEDKSNTTFGNARNSVEIMRTQGFKCAIVVTSPYHTRRASIIFDHFSQGLDLTICAAQYGSFTPDNWRKVRHIAKVVISEYMKLAWHYLFER